ncbi:MAG: acyl-CoA dehydrogenase family protein, partial [Achromobacter pestifer]
MPYVLNRAPVWYLWSVYSRLRAAPVDQARPCRTKRAAPTRRSSAPAYSGDRTMLLTEEQLSIQEMARRFAAERLAPNAERWDRD